MQALLVRTVSKDTLKRSKPMTRKSLERIHFQWLQFSETLPEQCAAPSKNPLPHYNNNITIIFCVILHSSYNSVTVY